MSTNVKTSLTSGVLASIAASLCCLVPFALLMVGISGAWISNLVSLARYKPFFIVLSLVFIGTGFWMVYFKRQDWMDILVVYSYLFLNRFSQPSYGFY